VTEYLDADDLLVIAQYAIGGEVAVRDHGLLASAAARPQASAFGADAYPSLHVKAAALLHSLAGNHPLVDGNKRLAWLATYVFLDTNGHAPIASQDAVFDLVVAVASGALDDLEKIAGQLAAWSRDR
jgi:death-on-curing protein